MPGLFRRPPIVTVMGHVDHGKTTLLDCLRKSNVASQEAGSITQHIAAFTVALSGAGTEERITFLDTPGHAAFARMRKRGAQCCDLAVLVVAGDDGVMVQTREALALIRQHALPFIVAISKVDRVDVDRVGRVKAQLVQEGVPLEGLAAPSDAAVQCVPIAAATGHGVDLLKESIVAEATLLDSLQCDPTRKGSGLVLEFRRDRGRGAMATVLLRDGQARLHDWMVAGGCMGRVRGLFLEDGRSVDRVPPSVPFAVMGWHAADTSEGWGDGGLTGEEILFTENEAEVRDLAAMIRADRHRERCVRHQLEGDALAAQARRTLREYRQSLADSSKRVVKVLQSRPGSADIKTLHVLIKADVVGSVEAILDALPSSIPQTKARINVVAAGVGEVGEQDLLLQPNAIVLFNLPLSRQLANRCRAQAIDISTHRVIYHLLDHLQGRLRALLPSEWHEEVLGEASVRQLFHIGNRGGAQAVAGCRVTAGTLQMGLIGREGERIVFRLARSPAKQVVWEGRCRSMRHEKDEVGKVGSGMECGILLDGCGSVLVGDTVQQVRLVPRPAGLE